MDEPGVREERDLPPAVAQPPAQVDVLEVHVEAARRARRRSRNAAGRTIIAAPWIQSTRRMRSPRDMTQPARCSVSAVERHPGRRREAKRRGLHAPVGIAQARPGRSRRAGFWSRNRFRRSMHSGSSTVSSFRMKT